MHDGKARRGWQQHWRSADPVGFVEHPLCTERNGRGRASRGDTSPAQVRVEALPGSDSVRAEGQSSRETALLRGLHRQSYPWRDQLSSRVGGAAGDQTAGKVDRLLLAELEEEYKAKQEARDEAHEARISALEHELEDERDVAEAAEETAAGVQKTLDGAIDFRSGQRAEARGYLDLIELKEKARKKDDGAN